MKVSHIVFLVVPVGYAFCWTGDIRGGCARPSPLSKKKKSFFGEIKVPRRCLLFTIQGSFIVSSLSRWPVSMTVSLIIFLYHTTTHGGHIVWNINKYNNPPLHFILWVYCIYMQSWSKSSHASTVFPIYELLFYQWVIFLARGQQTISVFNYICMILVSSSEKSWRHFVRRYFQFWKPSAGFLCTHLSFDVIVRSLF